MPLNEQQIADAKAEFASIDANADGFITLDEVKAFGDKNGLEFTDEQAEMFNKLDKNADGKVSIEEMLDVL